MRTRPRRRILAIVISSMPVAVGADRAPMSAGSVAAMPAAAEGSKCPLPRSVLPEEEEMAVKPIPDGFHTVTPYLVVDGASKLIDFLKQAFHAQEVHRNSGPDGSVMHAQVRIGDSMVMLADAVGEHKAMPTAIYLYVTDTDRLYKRALDAGATSMGAPADQFYGDRSGGVKDPSGNHWWIATHKEDVSPEEMAKRAEAAMKQKR